MATRNEKKKLLEDIKDPRSWWQPPQTTRYYKGNMVCEVTVVTDFRGKQRLETRMYHQ